QMSPVIGEVDKEVDYQMAGNDHIICMDSEAGLFELNVMEHVLIYNLHQSLTIVQRVLDTFNDYCLKGIEANIDVCKAYVENSIGVITALNPHVGYKTATKVAKEALETGVP